MLITKKVLQNLNVYNDVLNWWVNNGLTSFDSGNLKYIKGDYRSYIDWLKDKFYNNPVRTYDQYGNELTCIDSNNSITTRTYDRYGNVLILKHRNNDTITYTYDKYGNTLSLVTDTFWVNYTYDVYGNVLTLKTSDGKSRVFTYDQYGNELTSKNINGRSKEFTYDKYGNKLTSKDNNNVLIRYEHIHTDKSYIIKKDNKTILIIPKDIK